MGRGSKLAPESRPPDEAIPVTKGGAARFESLFESPAGNDPPDSVRAAKGRASPAAAISGVLSMAGAEGAPDSAEMTPARLLDAPEERPVIWRLSARAAPRLRARPSAEQSPPPAVEATSGTAAARTVSSPAFTGAVAVSDAGGAAVPEGTAEFTVGGGPEGRQSPAGAATDIAVRLSPAGGAADETNLEGAKDEGPSAFLAGPAEKRRSLP